MSLSMVELGRHLEISLIWKFFAIMGLSSQDHDYQDVPPAF
jgi:hypothetical protein